MKWRCHHSLSSDVGTFSHINHFCIFLLHASQTRTSVVQPRSGTGRRFCEHSSQTAWPQLRQWWRFRSRTGECGECLAGDWRISVLILVSMLDGCIPDDDGIGEPDAIPLNNCSAVPNMREHNEQFGASWSGTQYEGRAESFIKSKIMKINEI